MSRGFSRCECGVFLISVIIATFDRAEALNSISLPCLLKQSCCFFEVILWDASDNKLSEQISAKWQSEFVEKDIDLRYYKAPRKGSSSQRNDAVAEARGEVIFFMDDDTEISPTTLSVLQNTFTCFPWLRGAAVPVIEQADRLQRSEHSFLRRFLGWLFFGSQTVQRIMRASTVQRMPAQDLPGGAEWLSTCCFAARKSVFEDLRFDERFEFFSAYARYEDVDFSHRVFLHYKKPLLVVGGAFAVHHETAGIRNKGDAVSFIAQGFYNSYLLKENFSEYRRVPPCSFFWEQRIARFFVLLAGGYKPSTIFKGFKEYRKALRQNCSASRCSS